MKYNIVITGVPEFQNENLYGNKKCKPRQKLKVTSKIKKPDIIAVLS